MKFKTEVSTLDIYLTQKCFTFGASSCIMYMKGRGRTLGYPTHEI